MTQQAFTIDEFINSYKLGRTKVYEEIAAGRLSSYRLGRRRYISAQAAADWQSHLESAAKVEAQGSEVAA